MAGLTNAWYVTSSCACTEHWSGVLTKLLRWMLTWPMHRTAHHPNAGQVVSCCVLCAPGSLPVPERWNGESASAALHLEETDPSDQVWPSNVCMATSWPCSMSQLNRVAGYSLLPWHLTRATYYLLLSLDLCSQKPARVFHNLLAAITTYVFAA